MKFSLFYFDGDGSARSENAYQLLLDSAKFADENDFAALWLPERHFHAFGGLYPSPAVIHAALSQITKNVHLRSGSVVAPLHHPVRVAEDWSVLDNLSGGRAGIAIAAGWTMPEFIMSSEPHGFRRTLMWQNYEAIQKLLAGESVEFEDQDGERHEVKTLPRPLQPRIPFWVACQSLETFVEAGRRGVNCLCSMLGETLEEVAPKIKAYRESLEKHGHDPETGKVTMMVHTFMGADLDQVKADVMGPFSDYLRTHYHLLEGLAKGMGLGLKLEDFSEDDLENLLQFGVEGYMKGRALIGTPESCQPVVESLSEAGVDEIACLIDFVQDYEKVMNGLPHIAKLANANASVKTLEPA